MASFSKNTFEKDTLRRLRLTTNLTIALTTERSVFRLYPIVNPRSAPWRTSWCKDFVLEIARGFVEEEGVSFIPDCYCIHFSIRYVCVKPSKSHITQNREREERERERRTATNIREREEGEWWRVVAVVWMERERTKKENNKINKIYTIVSMH